MTKMNKAREYLVDEYIKALGEDEIPWIKSWRKNSDDYPYNPKTGIKYKGVNSLILDWMMMKLNSNDPRFMTFKQASDKGYKIKKGSKGVPVEFWSAYDKVDKTKITLHDANKLVEKGLRKEEDFGVISQVYTVFNASQIEGIEPYVYKGKKNSDIQINDFVISLADNMGVGIREYGDQAYYVPSEDKITMPRRELFDSIDSFNSTLLHELAHATGHKSRLDRKMIGAFGSESYAKEELRAEIGSSFLCSELGIAISKDHITNHKAYIKSWIKVLKDEPNELFKAIKDGDKICDYMLEKGNFKQKEDLTMEQGKKPEIKLNQSLKLEIS